MKKELIELSSQLGFKSKISLKQTNLIIENRKRFNQ